MLSVRLPRPLLFLIGQWKTLVRVGFIPLWNGLWKRLAFRRNKLVIQHSEYKISLNKIDTYIKTYKNQIPYFNYSNPVKHFYEQSNKSVTKLITRNGKRLIKELRESKELVQLLAKSTITDLDKEEKKKVKRQLLDICKTIPSLTIFLLPGGSLLLPILIKYIPQLLPSAFNENLED